MEFGLLLSLDLVIYHPIKIKKMSWCHPPQENSSSRSGEICPSNQKVVTIDEVS
jgi:hypothetical protein